VTDLHHALAHSHAGAMGAPAELDACPLMPTYGAPQVRFVRGQGAELWDGDGKRYLDFLSGLAVVSLGHANPVVADAIAEQARTLCHVSNLFGTEPGWEVARTLDELLRHGNPDAPAYQTFFCNSGAESNEAAIKLARKFGGRGRHDVVCAFSSFHGRTLATLHATGQPQKWEAFQPLPAGFRHVPWNDLEALEQSLDASVAAILLEPVQGEGGVNPATAAYFQGVERLCRERGVLFMVDEVQTGLGRTGEWFGFQHFGVQPDVVTMAKALGNGMPIGACAAKVEVAAAFQPGDHATTYGGQPLAASAAKAVLAEMRRLDIPAVATRAGDRLRGALADLPGVSDVRGLGLLVAAELDVDALGCDAKAIAADLLDRGLVVNAITPSALRLAPPLTLSDGEIDEAVGMIAGALQARPA
jgi:acetylornithine/N-succinyldiaminopimelate aminotransferase